MENSAVDTIFEKYLAKTGMDRKQYQFDGVKWCVNNETRSDPPCGVRGGFIADEMGLGKTITMIGVMLCNYLTRTLIVVPPVLIDQWAIQIYKTTGHKPLIYHGLDKKDMTLDHINAARIIIVSYSAISLTKKQIKSGNVNDIHKIKWSRIIFDEAHHLRNSRTTRYIGAKMLSSKVRWLVSGTPIQNAKKDFYSLCSMLKLPASFYTENDNLRTLARAFILKRTKKQVGIVLPSVHLDKNVVSWDNRKEMELSEELHSALAFSRVSGGNNDKLILNAIGKGGQLSLLLRARQSCIYPKLMTKSLDALINIGMLSNYASYKEAFDHSSKLDSAVGAILERRGNGCGKLIFCHFREEIDEIAHRLRSGGMTTVRTFDGRTTSAQRCDILGGNNEAVILQIQTGCEGLNLQEHYSEIYFISPHWNPAIEDQAIARCHRIGQTKPVYVQRFEMCKFFDENSRTVDNYVNDVQERKRIIASECIVDN
jgi:hypothetical protein